MGMLHRLATAGLLLSFSGLVQAQSCGINEALLSFNIKYDNNPNQINVDLTFRAFNSTAVTLDIPRTANSVVEFTRCVPANTITELTLRDSGGDGFTGNGYISVSINERLIATLNNFGASRTYYYVADLFSCANANQRFVLNLRHDNFPTEVEWTLMPFGGSNVLVDQSVSFMTGILENEFLYVDQCIPPGTYQFTISDSQSDGIATPGFWRVFSGFTLVGAGGGDQGFGASETANFVIADTEAPTMSPTASPTVDNICDDSITTRFFVEQTGRDEPCIWLQDPSREAERQVYCQPSHPSGAFDICEETCGKCSDDCEDDPTSHFMVNGAQRMCDWLAIRPFRWEELCVVGSVPYNECQETCENCPDTPQVINPIPMTPPPTPSPTTPAPTPAPTVAETIPAGPAPTRQPVSATAQGSDPCDDSMTDRFFVSDEVGNVPCVWLAARPEQQPTFCSPSHPSFAYVTCEETCGRCTDACEDDPTGTVLVEGVLRPCIWLSLRPNRQPLVCVPGHDAWTVCPETCGNCGTR